MLCYVSNVVSSSSSSTSYIRVGGNDIGKSSSHSLGGGACAGFSCRHGNTLPTTQRRETHHQTAKEPTPQSCSAARRSNSYVTRSFHSLSILILVILRSVCFSFVHFATKIPIGKPFFSLLGVSFVLFRDKNMDNHLKVFYNWFINSGWNLGCSLISESGVVRFSFLSFNKKKKGNTRKK